MKIPLSWISQYCDVTSLLSDKWAKELWHLYSIHTAEIEAIEEIGSEDLVLVGKVLSTRAHPNSDHLNLIEVDLGAYGIKPIVCGASNVVGAQYVPVAAVGARLGPTRDFEIKSSKIRGETSEGMICSTDELGLEEERAAGILRLEDYFDTALLESRLGTPFFSLPLRIPARSGETYEFPIRDTIFEIDNKFITNRPDLFSVVGNAREFGAIFSLPFTPFEGRKIEAPKSFQVRVESKNVLSYSILSFDGVGTSPSPFSIAQMLRRSGLPVKYDLVDITNYIMTELGQPMHAFDADKINGAIVVREAREWEILLALDGKEYALTTQDTVIADEKRVLAIAGIIGGAASAVSESTVNVAFESAVFDPVSVRLTSQRLGLRTDASMRYEKSLDPTLSAMALERVVELLSFLGKSSTPSASFHHLDTARVQDIEITADIDFITRKLGIEISRERIEDILSRLGFTVAFSDAWTFSVRVPSWRATKDVNIKEDIAEEIGRIHGYERIQNTPIHGPFSIATPNHAIALRDRINAYFSGRGWYEVYNYSFSNQKKDALVGYSTDETAVHIRNAFNIEYTQMRRSLAPNLLEVAAENLKQSDRFSFFEIGRISERLGENDFSEKRSIAGVSCGTDIAALRSVLDGLLRSILPGKIFAVRQGSSVPYLHPNRSGTYEIDGDTIVTFGAVHPNTAEGFGLSSANAYYFEIEYTTLFELFTRSRHIFSPIARFPGVRRELNFVLSERMPTTQVIERITTTHPFVSECGVVDIFRDPTKVGADKKSVTFSFVIQDTEKTITDEEALTIQNLIVSTLEKEEDISLRR